MRTRYAALSIVLLTGVAGPASGALSTTISALNLSSASVPAGGSVGVYGSVSFGVDRRVIATDPAEDVGPHQVAMGMDLLEASLTSDPAKPNDLVYTLKVNGLPPVLGGTPEAVFYWWAFTSSEELALDARRSNAYRQASANPFFRLRRCPGGECTDVATPNGSFDQASGLITATLKVNQIPGSGGEIQLGTIESSYGTGARWVYGLGDQMSAEDPSYRVPRAQVLAGLATPGGEPAAWTPLTVGSGAAPGFSGPLPTAGYGRGSFDVVVRACWGQSCATGRRALQVT